MEYFLLNAKEERKGPFSLEELKTELSSRTELVWTKEYNDWKRAEEVPELESVVNALPPNIHRFKSASSLRSWQKEAVFSTIINGALASTLPFIFPFCLIATPLAITGLIKAVHAEKSIRENQWEKAVQKAVLARKWVVWSISIGLIGGILTIMSWLVWLVYRLVLSEGTHF